MENLKHNGDLKKLIKSIPKEHKTTLDKIIKIAYIQGVNDMRGLISDLDHIPAQEITKYGIFHEDSIDGG